MPNNFNANVDANFDTPWSLEIFETEIGLKNLSTLHEAVEAGLRMKFPDMVSVETYPRIGRKIPTPCIVIEMSEMEPGHDPGTGQTALIGRFQARVIVDPILDGAELAVRELAARVAKAIHFQTWECPVTPAKLVMIAEDPFKPHLDTYLVWLVEWTHEFDLGDVVPPIPSGSTVVWGVVPNTGRGHELEYWNPLGDTMQDPPDDFGQSV